MKKIQNAVIKRLSEEGENLDTNIADGYVMQVVNKCTILREIIPLGLYNNSWEPESD